MLQNNMEMVSRGISEYFLFPLFSNDPQTGKIVGALVSGVALIGIVRLARRQEWKPAHFVLPCYAGLVLFWNFPDVLRYFIPFLPLFALGLWCEGKRLISMVRATFLKESSIFEKATAALLAIIAMGLACGTLLNYAGGLRRVIAQQSQDREMLL